MVSTRLMEQNKNMHTIDNLKTNKPLNEVESKLNGSVTAVPDFRS